MKVKIKLISEMLGTVAKDKVIFDTFIQSKKPANITEDESLTVDQSNETGYTGFHSDNAGLFIYDYQIKGFLKEQGNVLKDILGIKNLRSKIDDIVFPFPRRIYLGQDKPDGILQRPLKGDTPKGPRVSLKKSDYINAGKEIEFEIELIPHKEITAGIIKKLFSHGRLMGLGQWRNGGYGRFEVVHIEE